MLRVLRMCVVLFCFALETPTTFTFSRSELGAFVKEVLIDNFRIYIQMRSSKQAFRIRMVCVWTRNKRRSNNASYPKHFVLVSFGVRDVVHLILHFPRRCRSGSGGINGLMSA